MPRSSTAASASLVNPAIKDDLLRALSPETVLRHVEKSDNPKRTVQKVREAIVELELADDPTLAELDEALAQHLGTTKD